MNGVVKSLQQILNELTAIGRECKEHDKFNLSFDQHALIHVDRATRIVDELIEDLNRRRGTMMAITDAKKDKIKILDWELVEHTETKDYLNNTSCGKFMVKGEFSIGIQRGKFMYTKEWYPDNGGESVIIMNEEDFTENQIAEVEKYIEENAKEVFSD